MKHRSSIVTDPVMKRLSANYAAIAGLGCLLLLPVANHAQSVDLSDNPSLPVLTVVSIRPENDPTSSQSYFTGNGYHGEGVSLELLIKTAFNLDKDYQLTGMPGWCRSTKYQIEAKADDSDVPTIKGMSYSRRAEMLRPLLRARFLLESHWETRSLPIYELVIAKGGTKLLETPKNEYTEQTRVGGITLGAGTVFTDLTGKAVGKGVPVEMLIRMLSPYSNRAIVDHTGLSGNYDFTMQLPRKGSHNPDSSVSSDSHQLNADIAADGDASPLSIFTSVEDVGLKLVPRRAPLPVLVIDHVETPTPN